MITDIHAAAIGAAAAYLFRSRLSRPTWTNTCWTGLMPGLAQLSKATFLIFYPIWISVWIVVAVLGARSQKQLSRRQEAMMLAGIVLISLIVLNAGYEFEGTFNRLDTYVFHSVFLSGCESRGTRRDIEAEIASIIVG